MSALPPPLRDSLGERRAELARGLPAALRERLPLKLADIVVTRRVRSYFDFLSPAFQDDQRRIADEFGPDACDGFNRALLADFVRDFDPAPFMPADPPGWMPEAYANRVAFVGEQLLAAPAGTYHAMSDPLVKDLRLLGGVSFPNQDSLVDWQAYLPKTFYRYRGLRENLRAFGFIWFRAGGLGPYLRVHVDVRFTALRREIGHLKRRHEMAEVLMASPSILGQLSTSWMHDPAIEHVTPRLWSMNELVMQHGAFFKREGSSPLEIERATKTSETRRRLYEEGKYMPCSYTYVWPRRNIIAWHLSTVGRDGAD